jgi:hypothetical protein
MAFSKIVQDLIKILAYVLLCTRSIYNLDITIMAVRVICRMKAPESDNL